MQRTCAYLTALYLTAAMPAARAEEPPVTFARAGRHATVALENDAAKPNATLVLTAFGQPWGEPARVKDGTVEFAAPQVRVPVVFRVVALDNVDAALAELVVYPDRPARLEHDAPWIAAGAPDWFTSWCDALELPLARHRDLNSLLAAERPAPGRRALLVAGCETAGDDPAALGRLAVERNVNVLVLAGTDACSKGGGGRTITLLPKHARGVLADVQAQQWALPPSFTDCCLPFSPETLRIVNRQTWLAGPGWPLAEELHPADEGTASRRLVVSYLPWQRQLGRSEVADSLLLRLLAEAAKDAAARRRLDARWRLLHPAAGAVEPSQRPVLAAALGSLTGDRDLPQAYVLDLRGNAPLPADFFSSAAVKNLKRRGGRQPALLILGDSPALDCWKWLAVDRTDGDKDVAKSPRCRADVVWLRDDTLPPSVATQLRMMQLFTEWNISLEQNHGDRKRP